MLIASNKRVSIVLGTCKAEKGSRFLILMGAIF